MIRAVLDTNVLASGFLGAEHSRNAPGEIIRRWRRLRFHLVTSHHLISEFRNTYESPYFRQRMSRSQVDRAIELLEQKAEFASITINVGGVASHPEDDLVLAAAASARVDYLVTGDRMLLKLRTFEGVIILGPRDVHKVLDRSGSPQSE